jgi:hypothetical protein
MWRFWIGLAVVWLALLPPMFTDGSCTREFDAASMAVEEVARVSTSPVVAKENWLKSGATVLLLTQEECRTVKPRFLSRCGSGTLVYGSVEVKNKVCSLYRDDEIRFQMYFDEKGRLLRVATEMKPFKSLPLPFTEKSLYWAR